jgi:hypothetical protein
VFVALPLTVQPPYQGEGHAVNSTSPKNMGKKNITLCRGGDSGSNTERAETAPLFALSGRGEGNFSRRSFFLPALKATGLANVSEIFRDYYL